MEWKYMKKIFALLLSLILTVTYFSSAAVEEAPSLKHDVIVLFTRDVHCGGWSDLSGGAVEIRVCVCRMVLRCRAYQEDQRYRRRFRQ